jgi:hypothetical protein
VVFTPSHAEHFHHCLMLVFWNHDNHPASIDNVANLSTMVAYRLT